MNAMDTQQPKPAAPARSATPANAASKPGEGAAPEDAFAALLEGLVPAQGEETVATEAAPVEADTRAAPTASANASAPAPAAAFLAMLMPAAMVAGASNGASGKLALASDPAADAGTAAAPAGGASRRPDAVPDSFLAAATDFATRQPASTAFAGALATATAAVEERREPLAALPGADAAGTLAQPAAQPAFATDLAAAAPVHEAALASHPLETAFAGDLAAEVQWMVDAGVQQADLHLNPADLGPIRIHLSLTAQTADISFAAAHGTTREGLAQALPQLREMLAGQGLQLGQAGISGGQGGERQDRPERPTPQALKRETGAVEAARPRTGAATLRAGRGMLDLYA